MPASVDMSTPAQYRFPVKLVVIPKRELEAYTLVILMTAIVTFMSRVYAAKIQSA